MPRVSYTAPTTVDEAVKALASAAGSTKVLSGGTDLLVQLKSGRIKPDLIVDTKRIPDLIGIREEGGFFVIGAATPGVMLSANEQLEHALPGVVEGVDLIGSTQIQGRASIAGNLCNASPAADSVPPVIAARGIAVVAGPNGKREVPVENIVTGPGQTSLAKGEFVDRPQARCRHACQSRCCGAARLQADQRQARHDRIPHQGRRRPRAPGRGHRL